MVSILAALMRDQVIAMMERNARMVYVGYVGNDVSKTLVELSPQTS